MPHFLNIKWCITFYPNFQSRKLFLSLKQDALHSCNAFRILARSVSWRFDETTPNIAVRGDGSMPTFRIFSSAPRPLEQ